MSDQDQAGAEKELPDGADGDCSVIIDNGEYHVDIGETESGTWIWTYDGHPTLFHEFFALGDGNSITASYNKDEVINPFLDSVEPGEIASSTVKYTVSGTPLLVKRSVRMSPTEPTFTMKYDITNVGEDDLSLDLYQYADFDDGPNSYWDDVGHYEYNRASEYISDYVYIRDGDGGAYAGFAGSEVSKEHHVGSYPGYWDVLNGNLNNEERYPPDSGVGDAVVAMKWFLGRMSPGVSKSLTVQWGARTELEHLEEDIETPDDIETTPPAPGVSATGSTVAYVPGLSEEEDDGGDPLWAAFPNAKGGRPPRDFSTDGTFIGDHVRGTPDSLDFFKNEYKEVSGLDGTFRKYRFKNSIGVEFTTRSGGRIPSDQTVQIRVNGQLPDSLNLNRQDDDSPEFELDTFYGPPEQTSYTVIEDGIINDLLHPIGRNFGTRTLRGRKHERWVAAEKREFLKDGDAIDGIRVSTIWGASAEYAEQLAEDWVADIGDKVVDVPTIPIIYSWVELSVLADGTKLLRIPDASPFPKHAAYLGDGITMRTGRLGGDSGLKILFDTDVISRDDTYSVAVNEDHNNVWDRFSEEFQEKRAIPYYTSHLMYLYNYRDNWDLIDHPMIVYGETPDGNELSKDEVMTILEDSVSGWEPLSPFSTYYH